MQGKGGGGGVEEETPARMQTKRRLCYLQQTIQFFQSDPHAAIPNKLAFTSLHCSISNYSIPFSSDLISLCTNMIQINISPKGIYNLRLEISSLSDQICDAQQNIPGLIDALIAIRSTLLTPHQSEAAFVHEHSCFSKSRICRQAFPLIISPLPSHSSF